MFTVVGTASVPSRLRGERTAAQSVAILAARLPALRLGESVAGEVLLRGTIGVPRGGLPAAAVAAVLDRAE